MSKITNDDLTRSGTGCFIAVPIWATVGVKGLRLFRLVYVTSIPHSRVNRIDVIHFGCSHVRNFRTLTMLLQCFAGLQPFPGWFFPRKDVSRMVIFPDVTFPVCYVWWLDAKVYLSMPTRRWKFLGMNGRRPELVTIVQDESDKRHILVIFLST